MSRPNYWPAAGELLASDNSSSSRGAFQETYFERLLRVKAEQAAAAPVDAAQNCEFRLRGEDTLLTILDPSPWSGLPPPVAKAPTAPSSSVRFKQLLDAKLAAEKTRGATVIRPMPVMPAESMNAILQLTSSDTVFNSSFTGSNYTSKTRSPMDTPYIKVEPTPIPQNYASTFPTAHGYPAVDPAIAQTDFNNALPLRQPIGDYSENVQFKFPTYLEGDMPTAQHQFPSSPYIPIPVRNAPVYDSTYGMQNQPMWSSSQAACEWAMPAPTPQHDARMMSRKPNSYPGHWQSEVEPGLSSSASSTGSLAQRMPITPQSACQQLYETEYASHPVQQSWDCKPSLQMLAEACPTRSPVDSHLSVNRSPHSVGRSPVTPRDSVNSDLSGVQFYGATMYSSMNGSGSGPGQNNYSNGENGGQIPLGNWDGQPSAGGANGHGGHEDNGDDILASFALDGKGGGGGDEEKPKKLPLACHFCRGRKLKCDGQRPSCSHCAKRNHPCVYDDNVRRRGPGKRTKEMRDRTAREAEAAGMINANSTSTSASLGTGGGPGPSTLSEAVKKGKKRKSESDELEGLDEKRPRKDDDLNGGFGSAA
ncbi:hypothetical protein P7C73_g352, partial [Tremellales sp. Uapishka_1]